MFVIYIFGCFLSIDCQKHLHLKSLAAWIVCAESTMSGVKTPGAPGTIGPSRWGVGPRLDPQLHISLNNRLIPIWVMF